MFIKVKSTSYENQVHQLVSELRNCPDWQREELQEMRNNTASVTKGSISIHLYSIYVKRFTHIICDVLSKVPYSDDRFWQLAINLYDELGASSGFSKAHTKLLDKTRIKPNFLSDKDWLELSRPILDVEQEIVNYFKYLEWPLNLFALGPGTESISDLFLEPLEKWTASVIADKPELQLYFNVHRPEIESKHYLQIVQLIVDELSQLDETTANSIYKQGSLVAHQVAKTHLKAILISFQATKSLS